jgi:uncharacterized protein (TIGR02231 family)
VALCWPQQDAIPTTSTLDRVTVYSGQAMAERVFQVRADEPGPVTISLGPLPMSADPESFQTRMESGSVVVQGLEVTTRKGVVDESGRDVLRAQISALREKRDELMPERAAVKSGQTMVSNVMEAIKNDGVDHFGSMDLGALFLFISNKSTALSEQAADIDKRDRIIAKQIADLEAQLGAHTRGLEIPYYQLKLNLFFERPGTANMRLIYLVRGAGWEPSYDVRVNPNLDSVDVGLVAFIQQSTEEDWDDVEVLLSTARPHLGLDPPSLPERFARVYQEQKRGYSRGVSSRAPEMELQKLGYMDDSAAMAADSLSLERSYAAAPTVSVQDYGLTQQFRLPDRVDIPSGKEAKQFRLVNVPLEIRPERYIIPSLSQECFLRAEVTSTSDAPLLSGQARIFLGPDYIGEATFPMMRQGDSTTLNLGLDPFLAVEYDTVKEERDEPGMFGKILELNKVFETRLHLSSAAPESIEILVEDVLPVSQDDRMKIAPIEMHKGALESEQDLKDRKERGIYRWRITMRPGQKMAMRWGFTAAFNENLIPIFDN